MRLHACLCCALISLKSGHENEEPWARKKSKSPGATDLSLRAQGHLRTLQRAPSFLASLSHLRLFLSSHS